MIPVYPASKLKEWDKYTLMNQNMKGIDLMERAATVFVNWFCREFSTKQKIIIFCGNGNNGGDGLAIARLLLDKLFSVSVVLIKLSPEDSEDFKINYSKLELQLTDIIRTENRAFDEIQKNENCIIIDCILGYGLNRLPDQNLNRWIDLINDSSRIVISVDVPSGMFIDQFSEKYIEAHYTLTFQNLKLCQLIPDTGRHCGKLVIGDIQLESDFVNKNPAQLSYLELSDIKSLYKPRKLFDWKTKFGHALIIGGKKGMAGAVVLAATACLHSGCGLCSVHSVKENRNIVQIRIPEAIFIEESIIDYSKYTSILLGPGMGFSSEYEEKLKLVLLNHSVPKILDADALNILAKNKWLQLLDSTCVISPHVGEFDRLFGKSKNGFERLKLAIEKARYHNIHIILKGRYTAIVCPDAKVFFNGTGNTGLAKGGSGDALSGILVSILAQGYNILEACLYSVYLHGLAADLASEKFSEESILPSDVIESLSIAIRYIKS